VPTADWESTNARARSDFLAADYVLVAQLLLNFANGASSFTPLASNMTRTTASRCLP